MKLDYGKRYMLSDGRSTGPLKINPKRSINYPYYDPKTGLEFDVEGHGYNYQTTNIMRPMQHQADCIQHSYSCKHQIYFNDKDEKQEPSYNVNTVVLSCQEYDRLKKIESTFKEMYELAKELKMLDDEES